VESLQPNKPRLLQFVHEGKKLSGYLIVRGDEKAPVQIRLKPWCTISGRLLTPQGDPLSAVRVHCHADVKWNGQIVPSSTSDVPPDKDGRFRIEGLMAGLKYDLFVTKSNIVQNIAGGEPKALTVGAGETKDLGDLTVKPME